uniref:Uncharacterized protein n=1 Tax=Arundo donax TaxID=35708 RepID=A0A0A9FKG7_ARUDO
MEATFTVFLIVPNDLPCLL